MKKLVAILSAFAFSSCTYLQPKAKDQAHKPVNPDVVANEFIFLGEPQAVKEYLRDNGTKADFILLSKETKGGWYQVKYEGDLGLNQIMRDLKDKTTVVEPNRRVHQLYTTRKADWPTDKYFFKQWAFNNIGQAAPYGLPGVRGADMDILKVWDKVTKGSSDIIVAVIDTGCDYTHPDLKKNIWINEKESPAKGGIAGKDDDENGYVDDVYGYDFVSRDRTDMKGVPGSSDPMDTGGHGTHCAGAIGATGNDGVGVAGVNQNVRIMCVRFLGDGGGTSVDAFRAIRYARENHANIMSNSWGGKGDESQLFKSELAKIRDAGILFVVAAGNDGVNNEVDPHYPAALKGESYNGTPFDNVLVVAASDNQDVPASFSNYGAEKVDVFAPGVAILSTYPQALVDANRPPYATMSGTSMATPYVSGVAALMMAANRGLIGKPQEVIRLINATADVKESMVGKVVANGRINAYRAVTADVSNKALAPVWQTKAESVDQRGFNQELVDIRKEIKVDGAKMIKVHFDFMQINEPYDSVYLYDKDFRLVTRVEKTEAADFWSPAVPGDTIHVRFVNSLVKQVTTTSLNGSSESECVARGAVRIEQVGDKKFQCDVDSDDSSKDGGGSKTYTSFNSEGFRIDKVSYVMADSSSGKEN